MCIFYVNNRFCCTRNVVYEFMYISVSWVMKVSPLRFKYSSNLSFNISKLLCVLRAVARSENRGGHVVLSGDNVPPPPACDRPDDRSF